MTDKLSIEKDAIRALADILVETDLTEIEYENEGHRIRVARNLNLSATSMAIPAGVASPAAVNLPNPEKLTTQSASMEGAIKSPMVGTVYVSSEPGAAPFVKVGDVVAQGQTLLIIEAMKVMNPIKAPRAGKITSILIKDAQPIEFGEPLLVIE
ncbi:acetyl-CoA carboxylase biotin carboxyl carrier protein [Candidatus Odyssella acanthamoebae]|uniref:Biotin carboxyl carrier protein of acetyl-CoA carboxylase n=1 Tax=Candidatus Odyssella acanthamoebae TaxID=91604 RepID=A0A077B215_9PROT|nr:acetyl-CoA carboxylase biotin carboxyl carrier protein [Candidatus Paracaedibacter acanthamoebae]AIK96985.1 acetyl-CoA carboxylase [Candidatus Paracaedibacter acanthamoebae]